MFPRLSPNAQSEPVRFQVLPLTPRTALTALFNIRPQSAIRLTQQISETVSPFLKVSRPPQSTNQVQLSNRHTLSLPEDPPPKPIGKITRPDIEEAEINLRGKVIKTPLVELEGDFGSNRLFLKLENLQPKGSFKLRGAGNAMQSLTPTMREKGVWTASTGNMAQAVAWYAKELGIPCTIVLPVDAPANKLEKIKALDANIIQIPRQEWFQVVKRREYDGVQGEFIHPSADKRVITGNAVIAKEILEDMPDVDVVIAPYGGGGLSCGLGVGMREFGSGAKVYACEPETAAALAASFEAGHATTIKTTPSFDNGMGAPFVFEEMWPIAKENLAGSIVVSIDEVVDAVKLLHVRSHIVAEGAGAASVAAAMKHNFHDKKIVCIISGGNIDTDKMVTILQNQVPQPKLEITNSLEAIKEQPEPSESPLQEEDTFEVESSYPREFVTKNRRTHFTRGPTSDSVATI